MKPLLVALGAVVTLCLSNVAVGAAAGVSTHGNSALMADSLNSVADQVAASLRVPDSAFSPATSIADLYGVADNATVDNRAFRSNHSLSYEGLNRLTGFYQRADWKTGLETARFRYQGNVFGSAQAATSAWQDGINHTSGRFGGTSISCSSDYGVTCRMLSYSGYENKEARVFLDYLMSIGTCLVETELDASYTLLKSDAGQPTATVAAINRAAVNAAGTACNGSTSSVQPSPPLADAGALTLTHRKSGAQAPTRYLYLDETGFVTLTPRSGVTLPAGGGEMVEVIGGDPAFFLSSFFVPLRPVTRSNGTTVLQARIHISGNEYAGKYTIRLIPVGNATVPAKSVHFTLLIHPTSA